MIGSVGTKPSCLSCPSLYALIVSKKARVEDIKDDLGKGPTVGILGRGAWIGILVSLGT